jgi:UDP-glucose 4-epimerase
MRCLVTGDMGYIGSHMIRALEDEGHEVLGVDLKRGEDILQCLNYENRSSEHDVFWDFTPDYVFHMACWPRVTYSVENPVKTMRNNVLATSTVLDYSRRKSVKRVIFSSSSSVVGNDDDLGPTNPYGLQKRISELECNLYRRLYSLETVSLRYFNVYSEDQPADGPYTTAIANFMEYIRKEKTPFITGDGEQRRDMVHVQDVVSANMFAMNCKKVFNMESYDVGTGNNISLNEIKVIVNKHFPDVVFEHHQSRPGEVLSTVANTRRLNRLGWKSRIKIDQGIEFCFKKLRKEIRRNKNA